MWREGRQGDRAAKAQTHCIQLFGRLQRWPIVQHLSWTIQNQQQLLIYFNYLHLSLKGIWKRSSTNYVCNEQWPLLQLKQYNVFGYICFALLFRGEMSHLFCVSLPYFILIVPQNDMLRNKSYLSEITGRQGNTVIIT